MEDGELTPLGPEDDFLQLFSGEEERRTKTDGKENSLSMKKKDPLFFHKYLARSNK